MFLCQYVYNKIFTIYRIEKIYIVFYDFFVTVAYFGNWPFVCGDDKQLSVEMTKCKYSHMYITASVMCEIVEIYGNGCENKKVVLVLILTF